jgi:uncharacterized protein (DUF983 family)
MFAINSSRYSHGIIEILVPVAMEVKRLPIGCFMKSNAIDAIEKDEPASPNLSVFLRRALRLRCPECGITRLFKPLRQTRSLHDWFTPLVGCPLCNYDYEREQGYFLMAIWGVQYFFVAGFGLGLGLVLMNFIHNIWIIFSITVMPTIALGFFFIRHAKSFYLAIDHFLDPQAKTSDSATDSPEIR